MCRGPGGVAAQVSTRPQEQGSHPSSGSLVPPTATTSTSLFHFRGTSASRVGTSALGSHSPPPQCHPRSLVGKLLLGEVYFPVRGQCWSAQSTQQQCDHLWSGREHSKANAGTPSWAASTSHQTSRGPRLFSAPPSSSPPFPFSQPHHIPETRQAATSWSSWVLLYQKRQNIKKEVERALLFTIQATHRLPDNP